MLTLIPLSFMLGSVLYAGMAVWRASIGGARGTWPLLVLGFAGMAVWNAINLVGNPTASVLAEILRNVLWTGYLIAIVRHARADAMQRWLATLPFVLLAFATIRAGLVVYFWLTKDIAGPLVLLTTLVCSLAFCIGSLIFVQSLYFAAHRAASGFRLVLFALALLWAYDLNLYAVVLLRFPIPLTLAESRGLLALALTPLFAIAARRKEFWSIALSRRLAFQSLSVVAIGGYFVFVAALASARPWLGEHAQTAAQIAALLIVPVATIVLLASRRLRAQMKVVVSKHLFEHRYDYRTEWLRFNATINSGGLVGLSPDQRAVKALADLMDAAGGLLFLRNGRERLLLAARFERAGMAPPAIELDLPPQLLDQLEQNTHVLVSPNYGGEDHDTRFPPALTEHHDIWLLVPLVRMSGLVGIVALGTPRGRRLLDWEDFDLIKVLSQQIATYVADAHSQAELEEARQFEEFNRRFAFIVHDIKNVVSQLSLVAANAEEHGANPRFQADMVSTLRNSVGKMTTLLSRLSPDSRAPTLSLAPVEAMSLLNELCAARRAQHPMIVEGIKELRVVADRAKLVTALDHLVQNAIEASPPDSPVTLSAGRDGAQGMLTVSDKGCGMSSEFIRGQLFKPFASTKSAGFGIGAGEARALVRQMGGDINVASAEESGTSFVVVLPAADA